MSDKLELELPEQEVPKPLDPVIPHEFQADWAATINGSMQKFKLHQIVTDRRLINQLIGLRAPVKPIIEREVSIITCPKCSHEIEVDKVPNVKRWLAAQKGK